MTQFFVIAVVLAVAFADEFPLFPVRALDGGWGLYALLAAPSAVICLVADGWIRFALHRLARRANRTITIARVGILLAHGVAVLGFGLLDVVRSSVGDLILIDEAITAAPAFGALIWTWLISFRVDSALAATRGETTKPTRAGVVVNHLRHDVLVFLLPIWALLAWSEWLDTMHAAWTLEALRWAGVLTVLCAAPLVLRLLWRTSAFPAGALHDQLAALARAYRVRYCMLRVWRPMAPIANAAVIGPVRFTRLFLITEVLLEFLPDEQIEAVMAHEVAHARCHHLPWLMAGVLSVLTMVWAGSWWAMLWIAGSLIGLEINSWTNDALVAGALVPAGIVCFLVFGGVSRRFEFQADAFAAAHLSGASERITEHGADTMAHALLHVAHINHIPIERWSFRHGSIGGRVERLYRLAGETRGCTPADRRVRLIKMGLGILTTGMVVWMVLGG
jgi:STE24 endopeptidase